MILYNGRKAWGSFWEKSCFWTCLVNADKVVGDGESISWIWNKSKSAQNLWKFSKELIQSQNWFIKHSVWKSIKTSRVYNAAKLTRSIKKPIHQKFTHIKSTNFLQLLQISCDKAVKVTDDFFEAILLSNWWQNISPMVVHRDAWKPILKLNSNYPKDKNELREKFIARLIMQNKRYNFSSGLFLFISFVCLCRSMVFKDFYKSLFENKLKSRGKERRK
jgi:hypothetical protein